MEIDCIKEKFAAELEARDRAVAELKALQENKQATKTELAQIAKDIQAQAIRADDAMKRGGRLNRIDETMMSLRTRREILEQRLERLESIGDDNKHRGLIADASHNLDQARHKLARAVVRALEEPRRKVADEMSERFRQGIALFDNYNSACEGLFQELNVTGLYAGSRELAPLPSCPALYQLLETGLLMGGPVHQPHPPVEPIAEPFGVPEQPPVEAEPEPAEIAAVDEENIA